MYARLAEVRAWVNILSGLRPETRDNLFETYQRVISEEQLPKEDETKRLATLLDTLSVRDWDSLLVLLSDKTRAEVVRACNRMMECRNKYNPPQKASAQGAGS